MPQPDVSRSFEPCRTSRIEEESFFGELTEKQWFVERVLASSEQANP